MIKKRKILYVIPILAGGAIGTVVLKPAPASLPKETVAPLVEKSARTSSVEREKPIENHILSSQTLLSKAIAISRENKNDDQMRERNEKIVKLVNEAISIITQAISLYPNDSRLWAQQAKIYQTIKDYLPQAEETAIASWQRAIELDRNNSDYCRKLAQIYLDQGKIKPAVFYLEKAVESSPTNPPLLRELAEKYVQAGMLLQARRSYQKLLTITSNKEEKEMIEKEIAGLEKLIAQSTTNDRGAILEEPREVILPDSPPLLEARHLAQGPIIALPASSDQESSFTGGEIDSNAFSGKGVIPAGETEVKICNNHLSPETQVYLAAETKVKNLVLMVKRKVPYNPETAQCSHFVAAIKEPLAEDLLFKWWIITD